jgi:OOP family OmpA-OmpF porin
MRHVHTPEHRETLGKNLMKSINALRLLGVAGLGSLIALSSFAQDGGYYYGGLSLGRSKAKIDEPRITASLLASGLTTTAMERDETHAAYKLFGGYQFSRNFALEAGYFNLGKFGFTSTTAPAGTLNGQIKLQGVNVDLVGTLPLTETLSAIARVGAQYARARDTFSGSGAVTVRNPSPSKSEANYKVGVGLQYAFSPAFLLRAEGERYRINDAVGNHGGVNVVSVSLVFPFGRAPAAAPRAMAAPVYVAPAPAPAPEPVVVLAPAAPVVLVAVERRRVSFSADSLFPFDQSTVRPEGKAALDTFARELQGTRFDVITVEGHTDRLGSQAYNQKLSAGRADAVKEYLVGSGGIDRAKISAVGKSESAPVTRRDDCKGDKPSAKLIACLQPDRRVEVEVAGTR